jgi:hypothetical protein
MQRLAGRADEAKFGRIWAPDLTGCAMSHMPAPAGAVIDATAHL